MVPLLSDAALAQIGDREAIRDCLYRYCRAIDRRDADLLAGVYWPGAWDHHGALDAQVEDFIPEVMAAVGAMDQTMHMLGNVLIRIEGESAAAESQFFAYHRMTGEDGGPQDVYLGGRYLDRMERRGTEWRIAERTVAYDWFSRGESADWAKGVFGMAFRTNAAPDDPGCALLGGAGG